MPDFKKHIRLKEFVESRGYDKLKLIYPRSSRDLINNPRTMVWRVFFNTREVAVKYRNSKIGWNADRGVRKSIDSESILELLDVFKKKESWFSSNYFLVEPYAESLESQKISKEWFSIYGGVLDGMRVLHDAGFVHTDIAPSNIFVAGRAKLGDFEFATRLGKKLGNGFRRSIPPEYHSDNKRRVDRSIDLYGFCNQFPLDKSFYLSEDFGQLARKFVINGCGSKLSQRYSSLSSLADAYYSLLDKLD